MKTNSVGNSLDSFKLYYEETEKKVKKSKITVKAVGKTTSTSTVKRKEEQKMTPKSRVLAMLSSIRERFNNVVKKLKIPRKKAKKTTKEQRKLDKQQRNRGILGLGLLLVVVSIAYSTSVIFIGVDSPASKLVLIPQALFALATLFKAFSKLYK